MDRMKDSGVQSGDLSIAECDTLIAASRRARQAEEYNIGNCSSVLHVGYFFDGTGRNIEQDASESRLSNIAKLYRAYPDEPQNTHSLLYRKHYFSGLGTPFEDEVPGKLQSMMDNGWQHFLDEMKSLPEDIATDMVGDVIKKGDWQEALSNPITKLTTPKEWRNLLVEKGAPSLFFALVEGMPILRDSALVSDFLLSGVDTRVNNALFLFEKSVKEAKKNEIPLSLISVSLFGFDLGGTLARQFLDKLLNQLCTKDDDIVRYQGIPVDIAFVGLFDCSRHTGASRDNGLDTVASLGPLGVEVVGSTLGEHAIEQTTPLPSIVKRSLHLVAAHERRLWRPAFRTGLYEGEHIEKLVPGCSEDVGGGLKENEQKPSAELNLYSLHEMYRAAEMAGVPFPSFATLYKTDSEVASYFVMKDSVKGQRQINPNSRGKSVKYWVNDYQRLIPQKYFNMSVLNQHLNSYFIWLGEKYFEYHSEIQKLQEREDHEYRYAGITLGMISSDMNKAKSTSKEISILKKHWGWLDDVNDEAKKLCEDFERGISQGYDLRVTIGQLWKNRWEPAYHRAKWFRECRLNAHNKLPLPQYPYWFLPVDNILFSYFVHDIQARDKSESITNNFFAIRKVEIPADDEVTIPSEKIKRVKEPVAYEPNKSIDQFWGQLGKRF